MIIEPTEIQTYLLCPRMWHFRYIQGLSSKHPSDKLFLGSAVHHALDHYYEKVWTGEEPAENTIGKYNEWCLDRIKEIHHDIGDIPPETYEELKDAQILGEKLLVEYINHYSKGEGMIDQVMYVEEPFELTITDNVSIGGRFDMVVSDEHGFYWVVDHKTTGQFMKYDSLKRDVQMRTYAVAGDALFDNFKGIIVNQLRKSNPDRARVPVLKRERIPFSNNEHKNMIGNLQSYAERIGSEGEQVPPPSPDMHCGWRCQFNQLCEMMETNLQSAD